MKYFVPLVVSVLLASCTTSVDRQKTPANPSNIIFLIGDGMGLSAVSTTVYCGDEISEFGRFKEIGLIRTSSATLIPVFAYGPGAEQF